jgi:hypothetical protein
MMDGLNASRFGGNRAAWGAITGTIAEQSDLNSRIAADANGVGRIRHLREFGNVSNSNANHTSVILSASAAQAAEGFVLHWGPGIFNLDAGSIVDWKGSMVGVTPDFRRDAAATRGTVIRNQSTAGGQGGFRWSSVNGFYVQGIRFESPNVALDADQSGTFYDQAGTMLVEGCESFSIQDVMVWRTAWNALLVRRSKNGYMRNLHGYASRKDMFHTSNGGGASGVITRNIVWDSCVSEMGCDDAFPVIGYYDGTPEKMQPIIENVAHINCRVNGVKEAHAFRPTGVRGYFNIGCSVMPPPAGFPTVGLGGTTFGTNGLINFSNSGFPTWATKDVVITGFYADNVVWAGAQRALVYVNNISGTDNPVENITIQGRSRNTKPTNGILFHGGNAQDFDINWDHQGGMGSTAISYDGGSGKNKIALRADTCDSSAIFLGNTPTGQVDIDLELVNAMAGGGGNNLMTLGVGSGTFQLSKIDLTLKIANQTSAFNNIGTSLSSANATPPQFGRFLIELHGSAFTAAGATAVLSGTAWTSTILDNHTITATTPVVLPPARTAQTLTIGALTNASAGLIGTAASGNTGSGTFGSVTIGSGAIWGNYLLTFQTAGATGRFVLTDPRGAFVGYGNPGTAFNAGGVTFTLSTSVNWVVGDSVRVAVTLAGRLVTSQFACFTPQNENQILRARGTVTGAGTILQYLNPTSVVLNITTTFTGTSVPATEWVLASIAMNPEVLFDRTVKIQGGTLTGISKGAHPDLAAFDQWHATGYTDGCFIVRAGEALQVGYSAGSPSQVTYLSKA